jgi:hypothetical protein
MACAASTSGEDGTRRQKLLAKWRTMSLWLVDKGRTEQAIELYALASLYPHIANSRWFEDVVGRWVTAAAAHPQGVPPQVVSAAQERGRASDLWDTAAQLATEMASPMSA